MVLSFENWDTKGSCGAVFWKLRYKGLLWCCLLKIEIQSALVVLSLEIWATKRSCNAVFWKLSYIPPCSSPEREREMVSLAECQKFACYLNLATKLGKLRTHFTRKKSCTRILEYIQADKKSITYERAIWWEFMKPEESYFLHTHDIWDPHPPTHTSAQIL